MKKKSEMDDDDFKALVICLIFFILGVLSRNM